MHLRHKDSDLVELNVSLEQLKRIYTALYCRLQTGGCRSFVDFDDDDLLLTIQSYLQKEAAVEGVDCTDHAEWEAFVGITHPATCPRKGTGHTADMNHPPNET